MNEDSRQTLHEQACRDGEEFYVDPETGWRVFTEVGLRRRGSCCGSGCRHCPYAHEAVPVEERARLARQSTWMTGVRPPPEPADVLFWSGGKDSFLTYRALRREDRWPVVLLTTFDAASRKIAHQELDIGLVARQADCLGVPLLGVPLHPGQAYEGRIGEAARMIPRIARFVFGDLHLEHIRDWRAEAFRELAESCGASLHFPLWGAPYEALMDDLEASGAVCEVSAVTDEAHGVVRVGQRFDRAMMAGLPEWVDRFGENGEFHTLVKVWAADGGALR